MRQELGCLEENDFDEIEWGGKMKLMKTSEVDRLSEVDIYRYM